MLKEYKHALFFLAKYIAMYLVLNTLYALYVEGYKPDADPITIAVTKQGAFIMSIFDADINYHVVTSTPNVPITRKEQTVIEVFEGCNSVNVIIVFASFLIAFTGPVRNTAFFLIIGGLAIYFLNLMRVMALYWVALKFPQSLYFFHKFFFTGIIYLFVFWLWYVWVTKQKQWKLSGNR